MAAISSISTPTALITRSPLQEFDEVSASEYGAMGYFKSRSNADKTRIILNVAFHRFARTATITAVGVVVGGAIGAGAGYIIAGPLGSLPGVIIGGLTGGALGVAIAVVLVIETAPLVIEVDDRFNLWKLDMIREKIFEQFQDELRSDEVFKDLCCPISLMLPQIPVRAPCGHIYDKEEIEKWLDQKPDLPCHLKVPVKFTKADLKFDHNHLRNILRRCLELKAGIKPGEENRVFNQGLSVMLVSGRAIHNQVFAKSADVFMNSVKENIVNIDPEVAKKGFSDLIDFGHLPRYKEEGKKSGKAGGDCKVCGNH